ACQRPQSRSRYPGRPARWEAELRNRTLAVLLQRTRSGRARPFRAADARARLDIRARSVLASAAPRVPGIARTESCRRNPVRHAPAGFGRGPADRPSAAPRIAAEVRQ